MFNQLSCTVVLCDMLFNNGMYRDLVRVIQRRQDDQSKKIKNRNRFQNYLLFGACYKLVSIPTESCKGQIPSYVHMIFFLPQNTSKDFQYALEVWNNCEKSHQLTQGINFLAMLAINQKQIEKAYEILPSIDKHFSSINVRLLAHCECDQYAKAIDIIEINYKNHSISNEVVSGPPFKMIYQLFLLKCSH